MNEIRYYFVIPKFDFSNSREVNETCGREFTPRVELSRPSKVILPPIKCGHMITPIVTGLFYRAASLLLTYERSVL